MQDNCVKFIFGSLRFLWDVGRIGSSFKIVLNALTFLRKNALSSLPGPIIILLTSMQRNSSELHNLKLKNENLGPLYTASPQPPAGPGSQRGNKILYNFGTFYLSEFGTIDMSFGNILHPILSFNQAHAKFQP